MHGDATLAPTERVGRPAMNSGPLTGGAAGARRTTFCRKVLGAACVQVSKDLSPNARYGSNGSGVLVGAQSAGRDVAVDNINPSPAVWLSLIETGGAACHAFRL